MSGNLYPKFHSNPMVESFDFLNLGFGPTMPRDSEYLVRIVRTMCSEYPDIYPDSPDFKKSSQHVSLLLFLDWS
jgi:hypothetical protein